MKRLIIFCVVFMSIALQNGIWAQNYDFTAVAPSGQTLYYNIVNGEAQVTYGPYSPLYTGLAGNLTIPPSVTYGGITYRVSSINSGAFHSCWSLITVIIPNSVTYIGAGAFGDCRGLVSVNIPDSVTHIGNGAFGNCMKLTTVDFNAINCTYMSDGNPGRFVFHDCPAFTTLNIGENVTNIPNTAFWGCWRLSSVTIPNSVTNIGNYAFDGCGSMTNISIPKRVTWINEYTFADCIGLTSITIPDSVTYIGDHAFEYCNNLTFIVSRAVVPPGFGYSAFGGNDVYSRVPTDIPLYVPCGSEDNYANSAWGRFSNIICFSDTALTVTVTVNAGTGGSVTGGGEVMFGENVTLRAVAEDGYRFLQWNDGDTNAKRIVVVTSDTTFGAYFESTTQGIGNIEDNIASVYPNPTSGIVNVDAEDVIRIDVYNVNGKLVKSVSGNNVVDITALSSGIYSVKVTTLKTFYVCKVIKR